MSINTAILTAFGICVAAAALEGLCAGKNVKSYFAKLKFPRYAAPLWAWSIIGVFYYVIFCFVIYRLLRLDTDSSLKWVALALIGFMMLVNALTNYVIFRAHDLYLSFIIGSLFPIMDVGLFLLLLALDKMAASALIPYLLYRPYAVWWGYGLWKANRRQIRSSS